MDPCLCHWDPTNWRWFLHTRGMRRNVYPAEGQLGSLAGAFEMLRGARAGSRDPAWCPCHQQCWEGRFTPSWELYPCTLVLPGGFCSTANSFQLWIPPVTGGLGISAGHSAGGGDEPLLVVTRNINLGQIRIRLGTTTWKAGPLSSNWWVKIPDKPYEGDLGRPRKSVSDHICIPPSSMFYFWLQAVPVISKEIQL